MKHAAFIHLMQRSTCTYQSSTYRKTHCYMKFHLSNLTTMITIMYSGSRLLPNFSVKECNQKAGRSQRIRSSVIDLCQTLHAVNVTCNMFMWNGSEPVPLVFGGGHILAQNYSLTSDLRAHIFQKFPGEAFPQTHPSYTCTI